MTTPAQPTSPTSMETLVGFTEIEITYKRGGVEKVRVLQLGVDHYPALMLAFDSEPSQIEIYCEMPKGWAQTLSVASHNLIMETAEALNADFFAAWVRRRMRKMEMVSPGISEKMFPVLNLPGGLQKPPSSAELPSMTPENTVTLNLGRSGALRPASKPAKT